MDGGRYGPVEVSVPEGDVRGYVVLFADPGAPPSTPDLTPLNREGALVVSVDTRRYFEAIRRDAKACDQLVGDVETLSRQLQRRYPALEYAFPVLAGSGQAGTLAYAILAQAPNNTLSGAISIDPAPGVAGIPALCPGAPATTGADGVVAYGAKQGLQGFWIADLDAAADPAEEARLAALKAGGTDVAVERTPGHDAVAALAGLVAPHLSQATGGGVAALPLVELPAAPLGSSMAVVLSGDGGWRDIDKVIAEKLQADGVSVVGWDCLRYFWRRKSPEQAADDLAATLRTYATRWKPEKIALIGYSFGADVLPFLYDRLPPSLQGKVALVSLLGLESKADWEITVSGWLGEPPSEAATPIAPAVARMPPGLIQCFYGKEEEESACPSFATSGIELIETPGGHHFGHDYDAVANDILAGLARRSPPSSRFIDQPTAPDTSPSRG